MEVIRVSVTAATYKLSAGADRNLPFVQHFAKQVMLQPRFKDISSVKDATASLAEGIGQFLYAVQFSGVKGPGLKGLLADQLSNTKEGSLEREVISFVLHNDAAYHEIGNLLLGDIADGNGTETKNDAAAYMLVEASKQENNPDRANDCERVGDGYANGVSSSRDRNALFIESETTTAGFDTALQYYQQAADLGHTGVAVKIEAMIDLRAQYVASIANPAAVAASDSSNSASSSTSTKRAQDQLDRIVQAGLDKIAEQSKKNAILADKDNNVAVAKAQSASFNATEIRLEHQNQSAAAA